MSDTPEHPEKRRWFFWTINICFPLFMGTCVYLFCRPDTHISATLIRFLSILRISMEKTTVRSEFLRFYLCDILWAYALTFTINLLIGQSRKGFIVTAIICLVFEALIEFMQKWQIIYGTFDGFDIVSEALTTAFAISFIIYHTTKQRRRI